MSCKKVNSRNSYT